MNIKITEEDHKTLKVYQIEGSHIIGSRMYGTHNEDSDTDVLCFYDPQIFEKDSEKFLGINPSYQFQYDDEKNNVDYLWTTKQQFFQNLYSGDSTINAEVVMWSMEKLEDRLKYVRTYNCIKAYLGFCKRDLKVLGTSKDNGNRKFHIVRGLYIARSLLNGDLPSAYALTTLQNTLSTKEELKECLDYLKERLVSLYQSDRIPKYPEFEGSTSLATKLLKGCNTREFKYD